MQAPEGAAGPCSATNSVALSGLLDSLFSNRGLRDAKSAPLATGYSLTAPSGLKSELRDRKQLVLNY